MKQTILVAGAPSGFELLMAEQPYKSGYNVIGTGRTPETVQTQLPFKMSALDIAYENSLSIYFHVIKIQ